MANNRMSLVNTATGQRILLATHLATKWRALAGIEAKLDHAFEDELSEFPAAWGSTAWRLEYETDEPKLDEELRRTVERRTAHLSGVPDSTNGSRPWFYEVLQAYAVFCKLVPDDESRAALAEAIDDALFAWSRGREPSAMLHATIEAGVMRGDIDAVIAPALVALFAQIEAGGRSARTVPLVDRLDRLQRRILEIWASEMRQASVLSEMPEAVRAGERIANELVQASEGRELTADTLDTLKAMAIEEGPRGRALRRALEVCEGQAARTS